MAALIGALRVQLGLETAQFEQGTKRARMIAKRDATEIQRTISGIRSSFAGLAAGVAAIGLGAAAKRALDYAASLGEISQQVGVTVEQLQEYRYAATQVNLTQDQMEGGLARLTKSIGEAAAGNKPLAATFYELGVSVRDVNNDVMATGDVMPRLADAFAKIKDPATQARLAADLFGRQAGQKMLPLLTSGSEGLKRFADEAHGAGMVLSKELSDKADKASDRLAALSKQLEGNFAAAVAEGADGIVVLGDALSRLLTLTADGIVALRNFGIEARKTLAAGGGWTITGKPVKGEIGMANRAEYFRQSVAGDPKVQAWLKSQDKGGKPPPAEMGELSAPSGGKARGGRAARPERDRTQDRIRRYDDELAAQTAREFSLRQQLSNEVEERLHLELRQIDLAADGERQALKRQQTEGDLTAAQAKSLRQGVEFNRQLEIDLAQSRARDEMTREDYRIQRARIDTELELLRQQGLAARTQGEREKIAMQMLALELKREGLLSKEVLALEASSLAEKGIADQRLQTLDTLRAGSERDIRREYAGPLAKLIEQMPKDANELKEAYEAISAEGLASLGDGLADVIAGSRTLGDVFNNVANRIISDLARIAIQQALIKPLADSLTGSQGGGLFSALGRALGGGGIPSTASVGRQNAGVYAAFARSLPGMNSGGSFNVGGIPGVDRNMLSLNGVPVARVSHNERVTVSPASQAAQGSKVEIVLNDPMLQGRIVQGAAVVTQTGIRQHSKVQAYRATRRLA